jgi:hypothetical protein
LLLFWLRLDLRLPVFQRPSQVNLQVHQESLKAILGWRGSLSLLGLLLPLLAITQVDLYRGR